jgi:transposase-like protein
MPAGERVMKVKEEDTDKVMRSNNKINTKAILTCPICSVFQDVEMPINACQHFYKCQSCGETLKPKEGDCCVFCSYADNKCPPKQLERL